MVEEPDAVEPPVTHTPKTHGSLGSDLKSDHETGADISFAL